VKALTLIPAYGRDYTSAADAIADWRAGKDFRISDVSSPWDSAYVGRGESAMLRESGFSAVRIRFKGQLNVTEVML